MKQFRTCLVLSWLLFVGCTTLAGQEFTKKVIDDSIEEIIKHIDENYIVPEVRSKVIAGLMERHKSGDYDAIPTSEEFAEKVSDDLRELSNDYHLYLVAKSNDSKVNATPSRQMMRVNPDPAIFKNLLTYKMLEGNIAYLNVPMFGPLEYVKNSIDEYLELSKTADALIIDVRQCPGGSGESLAYLAGGFVDEPIHLTTYHSKEGKQELHTFKTPYGTYNNDKEVYVLVSDRTGSAAEGFAFYRQQHNRITVVGMPSAGGGRSNNFFPVGDLFDVSVSIRNSITPNGKQFQGVGVQPDLITPASNALHQAQISLYEKLGKENPIKIEDYKSLIKKVGKPEVTPKRGDRGAIKRTVLGYLENFFENKTEEMFKYLHPSLAKRGLSRKRGTPGVFFEDMSNEQLTAMLQKKRVLEKENQVNQVEILDIFHNSASVRVATGYPGKMEWIEYIHLARLNDEWKIINIIWDYYPKKKQATKTSR